MFCRLNLDNERYLFYLCTHVEQLQLATVSVHRRAQYRQYLVAKFRHCIEKLEVRGLSDRELLLLYAGLYETVATDLMDFVPGLCLTLHTPTCRRHSEPRSQYGEYDVAWFKVAQAIHRVCITIACAHPPRLCGKRFCQVSMIASVICAMPPEEAWIRYGGFARMFLDIFVEDAIGRLKSDTDAFTHIKSENQNGGRCLALLNILVAAGHLGIGYTMRCMFEGCASNQS